MVAHPLLLAELPTALKRNVGLDAVFYINLDHRGTRRMHMENLALGQDLHLTRVPAVDGRYLIPWNILRRKKEDSSRSVDDGVVVPGR